MSAEFTYTGYEPLELVRIVIDGRDATSEARVSLNASYTDDSRVELHGSIIYDDVSSLAPGLHRIIVEPRIHAEDQLGYSWSFTTVQ